MASDRGTKGFRVPWGQQAGEAQAPPTFCCPEAWAPAPALSYEAQRGVCTPHLGFQTWERGEPRSLRGPAPQVRPPGHTAGANWPPGGSSGRAGPRGT